MTKKKPQGGGSETELDRHGMATDKNSLQVILKNCLRD